MLFIYAFVIKTVKRLLLKTFLQDRICFVHIVFVKHFYVSIVRKIYYINFIVSDFTLEGMLCVDKSKKREQRKQILKLLAFLLAYLL